jgi:hypothetical protein
LLVVVDKSISKKVEFNDSVMDLEIPVALLLLEFKGLDDQVDHIVNKKLISKAGGLFHLV